MCSGSEVWAINKKIQRQLKTVEMCFLRRMMKVPWTAKTSNEVILQKANETRTLIERTITFSILFVNALTATCLM
jgi:hypothetical protein